MKTGWFYCQGDPPNTVRYWDGQQWMGQPHVPTAQSSEVHLPGIGMLADSWLRIVARLIDAVILTCAVYAINSVIGLFAADRALNNITTNGFSGVVDAFSMFGIAMIVSAMVAVGLSAAYEVASTMHFGATPGKLILGFRVVDANGRTPLDWQPALLRWLPFGVLLLIARMPVVAIIGILALFALSLVGFILILVSPTRQAPWDVIAKTYVIKKSETGKAVE